LHPGICLRVIAIAFGDFEHQKSGGDGCLAVLFAHSFVVDLDVARQTSASPDL
jgi:hypothetical protein